MRRPLPSALYAIADPDVARRDVVDLVEELLGGGATLIQLRCKTLRSGALLEAATRCRRLTRLHGAVLIVNDRVDVAVACDADGVHLGQTDLPAPAARRLLGKSQLLGVSTHDREQALAAAAAGADYIGFGPIFPTSTKSTGYTARGTAALRVMRQSMSLPIVAIGGITAENARDALAAGADAVAMISALVSGPSPRERVRSVLARLS